MPKKKQPPATAIPPKNAELERQLDEILGRVPPILRLPRPKERCPYSQLSRTGLVEIVAPCQRNGFKPPVPVTPLKRNERVRRGIYLIPAERLFRYLLSQGSVTTPSQNEAASPNA